MARTKRVEKKTKQNREDDGHKQVILSCSKKRSRRGAEREKLQYIAQIKDQQTLQDVCGCVCPTKLFKKKKTHKKFPSGEKLKLFHKNTRGGPVETYT